MRCDIRQNSYIQLCHWKLHLWSSVMLLWYSILWYSLLIFDIWYLLFHSAWNNHYWNFIRRETGIIEIVIRHGTQQPKFDFRFGMELRNQNSTSGLAGKARGKLLFQHRRRQFKSTACCFFVARGDKIDQRISWIIKWCFFSTSCKSKCNFSKRIACYYIIWRHCRQARQYIKSRKSVGEF